MFLYEYLEDRENRIHLDSSSKKVLSIMPTTPINPAETQNLDTHQTAIAIWAEVEKSKTIAIFTHKNADGDAVGSGLALFHTLREQFPEKQIDFIVPANIPKHLKGLPGADLIASDTVKTDSYDLAIAVDCDDELMDGLDIYKSANKQVNLDHHGTNFHLKNNIEDNDLFLVFPCANSATEVIYNKLFKPLNIGVSPAVAECLLTGLLTDTGCFNHTRNTEEAHKMSDELLQILNESGEFSVSTIMKKMDRNAEESLELNNLGNYLMENIKRTSAKNGKTIASIVIDKECLNFFEVKDIGPDIKEKIKQLVGKLASESDIGIVFWETTDDQEIRVSMRAKKLVIVDFAVQNGGGGHAHAIGATLNGDKDSVISDFISNAKGYDFKEAN